MTHILTPDEKNDVNYWRSLMSKYCLLEFEATGKKKIIKISRIENVITVKSMRTSIGGTSYDETYGQKGVIEIATFNIKSCQVLNYDTTLIFIKLENEDK